MSDVFISFIHEEGETAAAVQKFVNQMLGGKANAFLVVRIICQKRSRFHFFHIADEMISFSLIAKSCYRKQTHYQHGVR